MRLISVVSALLVTGLAAGTASAQNLVISNARIIVGDGQVIEKGSVVVKDGKIASVTAGAPSGAVSGSVRINGAGKTVMAGFIDVHRHLIYGPPDRYFTEQAVDRMRELLEAGFTTVQAGGDDNAAILELKRRVESGQIKGPRILAASRVVTGRLNSDDEVRNAIRQAKSAGYDSISEIIYPNGPPPAPPTEKETHNLAVALDEAAHPLSVRGRVNWQHLQRHIAIELHVPRQIHFAHPARAELRADFVTAKFCAGDQSH